MASYGGPRRINAVSIVLVLLAAAGGYWMWRYFPVYFDAWSVDHILKEAASETYRANRLNEGSRMEQLKLIVDGAKAKIIKQVGIHDPELTVDLNVDGDKATMTADYTVRVTHPVIDKTSKIHFHREEQANIKFVKWD
jgi:hypothetical protein